MINRNSKSDWCIFRVGRSSNQKVSTRPVSNSGGVGITTRGNPGETPGINSAANWYRSRSGAAVRWVGFDRPTVLAWGGWVGPSGESGTEGVKFGIRVPFARFGTAERGAFVGESTLGLAGATTVLGGGVASAAQASNAATNRTTVSNRVGRTSSLRYRDGSGPVLALQDCPDSESTIVLKRFMAISMLVSKMQSTASTDLFSASIIILDSSPEKGPITWAIWSAPGGA